MAVFSTIGNIIASGNQKKAANKAADVSQQNFDQVVNYARETRDANQELLNPFVNNGLAASNQINALLGLGGSQPVQQQPQAQPNALSQFQGY